MDRKIMPRDHVPRKYNLGWNADRKAVMIQVHRDCMRSAPLVTTGSPWFQEVSSMSWTGELFDSFSGNLDSEHFGLNRRIVRIGGSGDYVEFEARIPRIWHQSCLACEKCGGSGRRDEFADDDDPCLYCSGSRKEHYWDWRAAYQTTASLNLLFLVLDLCEDTSAAERQHITLQMMSEYGQHGSSLDGYFGIEFAEYLRSGRSELAHIVKHAIEAMKGAYGEMKRVDTYDTRRLRAEIRENGFLTMDCPGDACGIYMSDHHHESGRGRKFSCHNVDSPLQSLALLAGLASFVGQASFYIEAEERRALTAV